MSAVWISPIINIDENVRRVDVLECHTDVHLHRPLIKMCSLVKDGPLYPTRVSTLGFSNALEAGTDSDWND